MVSAKNQKFHFSMKNMGLCQLTEFFGSGFDEDREIVLLVEGYRFGLLGWGVLTAGWGFPGGRGRWDYYYYNTGFSDILEGRYYFGDGGNEDEP